MVHCTPVLTRWLPQTNAIPCATNPSECSDTGLEVPKPSLSSLPEMPFSSQVPIHNHCINCSGASSPKTFLPADCCPPTLRNPLRQQKAHFNRNFVKSSCENIVVSHSDRNQFLKHLSEGDFRLYFENIS